jgi:magnesium transporter
LTEMSTAQLVDLFSVLPHDDKMELLALLPHKQAGQIEAILSEREVTAGALMSADYVTMAQETTVGDALRTLRTSHFDHDKISYIYIVAEPDRILLGVVDLRELVLAADTATLGDLMAAPVVAAEFDDLKDDLAELFAKYHYRMIPVVNKKDCLLGVIHYNHIMKGFTPRTRV